ncbi:hypothetical protein B0T24DRAFT_533757, partial [Lasiosphaeria ovina]
SSRLSIVAKDRLNPAVYLSLVFANPLSLLIVIADNGCVLSGSRALNFFIPSIVDDDSNWDFYVNGYKECVINTITALEDAGVEWELLENRIRKFLRGSEKSMKIKVGEAEDIQSWRESHLIETVDLKEDVRRVFQSIIRLLLPFVNRNKDIIVRKDNRAIRFELPT